jgi:hypothetical protein
MRFSLQKSKKSYVMHEFCDGCASQYKSRHCLGDLLNSFREFGYRKIVRNFFETAHAKGPQDAAGGFLKNQADLAVVNDMGIIGRTLHTVRVQHSMSIN